MFWKSSTIFVLLIFVVALFGMIIPDSIESISTTFSVLSKMTDKQITLLEHKSVELANKKKRIINSQYVDIFQDIPKSQSDLLMTFFSFASRENLKISSIEPGSKTNNNGFDEVTYRIQFSGTYNSIGFFIQSCEQNILGFNIKSMNLKSNGNSINGFIECSIIISDLDIKAVNDDEVIQMSSPDSK